MKKRALAVLGVLLICVLCVFAAGLLLKKNREQNRQTAENETDTAAEAAVSIEEQEYINETIRDAEQVDKEGRIYDSSEYRKYGGFGFQITELRLYDTYDELPIQNYDERKEGEPAYYYPEADYACLEVQVTNESKVEKTLYPTMIDLILAENEMRGEPDTDTARGWSNVSNVFYVEGIENPQDDPKNSVNPIIGPEQTVSLKLYFEYYVETLDDDENLLILNVKDKYENPDYYIRLSNMRGEGTANPEFIYDITQDRGYIYLKCTPVEG